MDQKRWIETLGSVTRTLEELRDGAMEQPPAVAWCVALGALSTTLHTLQMLVTLGYPGEDETQVATDKATLSHLLTRYRAWIGPVRVGLLMEHREALAALDGELNERVGWPLDEHGFAKFEGRGVKS